jgi:hypothetical protein
MNIPKMKLPNAVTVVGVDKDPPFRERFRGREQSALNSLNGCYRFMADCRGDLEKRLGRMGAVERYDKIMADLSTLISEITGTADPDEVATIILRGRKTTAYIGTEKAGQDEAGIWMPLAEINYLLAVLIEDKCGMLCDKKGKDAQTCPIQKALKACTTLMDKQVIDGCMFRPYTSAAAYGLLGEEETI